MRKFNKILYTVLYGVAGLWILLTLTFYWLNTPFNWFVTLNYGLLSVLVICYVESKITKFWITIMRIYRNRR